MVLDDPAEKLGGEARQGAQHACVQRRLTVWLLVEFRVDLQDSIVCGKQSICNVFATGVSQELEEHGHSVKTVHLFALLVFVSDGFKREPTWHKPLRWSRARFD